MDFPKIKKEIVQFLSSEEAKVLKKNVAKLGLTASVIAAIMAQAQNSQASHTDSHDDSNTHGSHTSHTDGPIYSDHSDYHTDGHSDATSQHYSQPVYDPSGQRGGHSSQMGHGNTL